MAPIKQGVAEERPGPRKTIPRLTFYPHLHARYLAFARKSRVSRQESGICASCVANAARVWRAEAPRLYCAALDSMALSTTASVTLGGQQGPRWMSPKWMPLSPHRANGQKEGGGKWNGGGPCVCVCERVWVCASRATERRTERVVALEFLESTLTQDYHDQGASSSERGILSWRWFGIFWGRYVHYGNSFECLRSTVEVVEANSTPRLLMKGTEASC